MKIYIGENIKRLRREKGITQEKLADHLKISCQAVSKWERGETYPDITMVIPIASYFGVSTDEVLGLSTAENEKKIERYLDEYHRLGALGKSVEKFDLICEAHDEFPNDFKILEQYAWQLHYDPRCTEEPYGYKKHKDELYAICERILDECTLDQPRYSALSILGTLYMVDGKEDKAIETAKRFPDSYHSTANEEIENIYDRGTEKWLKYVRDNIFEMTTCLMVKIRNTVLWGNCSPDEKIRILQKAVDLIELVFDEKDYGFFNYELTELHIRIASRYIEKTEYEKAFEHLSTGLSYAKAYDDLPMKSTHTSYVVRGHVQDMMDICSGYELNNVDRELERLKESFYDDVREMDGFKAVIEKFTPFAGEKSHI